jgi:hypothetical protein
MPKDSFIVYRSFWEAMKKLPDKERLEIHDAIYMYHFEGNELQLSTFVDAIFSILKSQFDRDTAKYETIIERNRINGSKGGRPAKNPENPVGYLGNPEKPKETLYEDDTDTVDETETEKGVEEKPEIVFPLPEIKESDKIDFKKLVEVYHSFCPKMPKVEKITEARKKAIRARIKEHGKVKVMEALKMAGDSKFLNGDNERNWTADLDFVFTASKFVKILEGAYNQKDRTGKMQIDSPMKDYPGWD